MAIASPPDRKGKYDRKKLSGKFKKKKALVLTDYSYNFNLQVLYKHVNTLAKSHRSLENK